MNKSKTDPKNEDKSDISQDINHRIDEELIKPLSIHGALKLEVTTSTSLVTAGQEFSIYIIIHNPFDVPITLYTGETHIPVELSDEIANSRVRYEQNLQREERINLVNNRWEKLYLKYLFLIEDCNIYNRRNRYVYSGRVAETVNVNYKRDDTFFKHQTNFGTHTILEGNNVMGDYWNLDFGNLTTEEVRQILWDINEYKHGQQPTILQPGNSTVQHFILKTTSWLFFTPLAHTFQIQVTYNINNQNQTDTTPFSFNIQASMFSAMIGAIIGSLLGTFVHTPPNSLDINELGRTMLTSAIFAIIIVVAFARKSNVQQIVSVEDFWGGLFIGFLTGYSGESFINSIL